MLTPREKSPLPENFPRGGSNPQCCGQRAQTLPTSYPGPQITLYFCFPQRRIKPATLWTASPNTTNELSRPPDHTLLLFSPEEDQTRDAVDSEPKHYQRAIPAPRSHFTFVLSTFQAAFVSTTVSPLKLSIHRHTHRRTDTKERRSCPTLYFPSMGIIMGIMGMGMKTGMEWCPLVRRFRLFLPSLHDW